MLCLASKRVVLPLTFKLPDYQFTQLPNSKGSRRFFSNLGERVLLQMAGITVEFADAFGELLGRHGVLIVHPAEVFLGKVQALIFACLSCGRIKRALDRTVSLFQLAKKVGADGEQV